MLTAHSCVHDTVDYRTPYCRGIMDSAARQRNYTRNNPLGISCVLSRLLGDDLHATERSVHYVIVM